ncbi:MAG: hypothetical protein QOF89_2379 [Acidobacteriota bacterium]|nr:hypothetical protein [Acidobacteriota bacterium]
MRYPIAIEPGDAKHAYGVVVPNLPGCFSAGDTLDEAIANAPEAIALWLEDVVERGEVAPAAKPFETHRENPEIAMATVARVDVVVRNFKHIVNLYRIHGYNSVNLRRGYPTLEIRAPREILPDE